ncbi:MAG: NUDIX domain-containing protein [Candidatus Berkelbacteria bacterium]|nr:NUDIX domain-containing protein [Candidatus Berkelbacteria bacterium]
MIKKIQVIPYKIESGRPLYFIAKRSGADVFQPLTGHVGDSVSGEKIIEAALRETNEEIGIKHFYNFINAKHSFTFMSGPGKKYKEYVFALEVGSQKITLEEVEFESYEFLTFYKALERLTWNSARKALKIINAVIVNKKYPKIFTVSGAGGSGKETVINEILKNVKNIKRARTANTRPVRAGEKKPEKGRVFLSKKEFERLDSLNEIIESNFFNGDWYGTPWKEVDDILAKGKDVIMEVDVNGVKDFKEKFNNVISIFLWAELADLKKRLILRGQDSPENIKKRLKIAEIEVKKSKICDHMVANRQDKLDEAVKEVIGIINKNRSQVVEI